MVLHESYNSYVLHGACEMVIALLECGIDVVLARHLVAHFDALIEEDFVGFFDLFFRVVGDHFCGFVMSRNDVDMALNLIIGNILCSSRYQTMVCVKLRS